jgi:rare lipoprotein A (peptidoglycan hydrolase)
MRWLILAGLLCPTLAQACTKATVYAARYDGRTMANGAIYRHAGISAASARYALGTRLLVVHGHKHLLVTVTDTMPRRGCVALDLSGGAAYRLGVVGTGKVVIKRLG